MENSAAGSESFTNGEETSGAPSWQRARGSAVIDGAICIGRVGAPPTLEATSEAFYFWVPANCAVEKSEIVITTSQIGDATVKFYGIVDEVRRCSRRRSIGQEYDEFDGDLETQPLYESEGVTYAAVSILRTDPPRLLPPRERSAVVRASTAEAQQAYGADEIDPNSRLEIGLMKNGGETLAGPGIIDLDYMLGANGGHLNVNGSAGRGTKSSFLLHVNRLLLEKARRELAANPSGAERLRIVPIILNVKNFDLFYINLRNKKYDPGRHASAWTALGINDPQPFTAATFFAPMQPANSLPIAIPNKVGVSPYSWGLTDIIERNLLEYLFSDQDANDINFSVLLDDLVNYLTFETVLGDGSIVRTVSQDKPRSFEELIAYVDGDGLDSLPGGHHPGTIKKFKRRLRKIIYAGRGILRYEYPTGQPLVIAADDNCDPIVIDISSLVRDPFLQRFVVAVILEQLIEARTGGNVVNGLKYVVTIDELNRFAPKGARDPITQLVEKVAAEMRSQGIILLGAQQQASKVSERVIENSGIRALGKTGMLELSNSVWSGLSKSAKTKADALRLDEKLVLQDNFREPMQVKIPFPSWPMRREEAILDPGSAQGDVDLPEDL
jgi:DNA helicase HerA-like ATPase